jgi:hypothetical protein
MITQALMSFVTELYTAPMISITCKINKLWFTVLLNFNYRVIHKFLRNFRPLRYRSQDGHAEGEHVNRWRDTPSFCPTLQVLDMSTLSDEADVNPVIKFLPHTLQHLAVDATTASTILRRSCCKSRGRNLITGLTSAASPRVDISSTCKIGQKLGVSLPLLTCSPLAWPSGLLYRRGQKSRRDLWITLYNDIMVFCDVMLCNFVDRYQCIRKTYCLHSQCTGWSQQVPPNYWYLNKGINSTS